MCFPLCFWVNFWLFMSFALSFSLFFYTSIWLSPYLYLLSYLFIYLSVTSILSILSPWRPASYSIHDYSFDVTFYHSLSQSCTLISLCHSLLSILLIICFSASSSFILSPVFSLLFSSTSSYLFVFSIIRDFDFSLPLLPYLHVPSLPLPPKPRRESSLNQLTQ